MLGKYLLGPKVNSGYHPKPLLPTPLLANKPNAGQRTNYKDIGSTSNWKRLTKFIHAVIRVQKIAKGLCYYCDQPFDKGHQCASKSTQLFLVEVPGEDDKDSGTGEFSREVNFDLEEMEPQVSTNAMNEASGFHTMRINDHVGKKTLHILIDSGSTHNFLDVGFAKKFGCKMEPIAMKVVTIADGISSNVNMFAKISHGRCTVLRLYLICCCSL